MFIDAHLHVGMFLDIKSLTECASKYQIFPIAVATTLKESSNLLKTLDSLNLKLPVFVGIHPWYLTQEQFDETLMENLLKDKRVVGIGECGLDGKIATPLSCQLTVLEQHLEFAKYYQKPVNLHIRSCHGQLTKALKKYQGFLSGMIHNTTFSYEVCKNYLDLGFKLSFGHHILFNQDKLNQVLKKVGLDNIVLETDFDYVHTGLYDPSLIIKEYEYLSAISSCELSKLQEQLCTNVSNLIGTLNEFNLYC